MRLLYRLRIWAYLALAAVLIALPLLSYINTLKSLIMLSIGMFVLMLAAYAETYRAARRGTRIVRAMHGQRDLLIMADFSLKKIKTDIWQNLWHTGGWAVSGALLAARFSLALALAQYFFVFTVGGNPAQFPYQFINPAVASLNYISVSNYSISNGVYTTILQQPEGWQQIIALLLLILFGVIEMRFWVALCLFVTLRTYRIQRWTLPISMGLRLGLAGFGLLAIMALSLMPPHTVSNYGYPPKDLLCTDSRAQQVTIPYYYRNELADCARYVTELYAKRIKEAMQSGFVSLIDGGALLASGIMRADLTLRYTGNGFDNYLKMSYTPTVTYPVRYHQAFSRVTGPMLPVLRHLIGIVLPAFILLALTRILYWLSTRPYRTRVS